MSSLTLWVFSNPAASYLKLLEQLPAETNIVTGNTDELFHSAPDPDAVMIGFGQGALLQKQWPRVSRARWLHSFSAGLETTLFPELVESSIPMSNAKGVFGRSLGEFAIASALYFAKDFRRMMRSQQEGKWDPYDVVELTGKTFGIVGYGGIGREAAQRAKAMGMRVLALRRHPEKSADDPHIDAAYGMDALDSLIEASDYLLVAAPNAPGTQGMIGEKQFSKMKPDAVVINLGRGPVIAEDALIRALEQRRIKGAALDVFDVEPLPAGHAFYRLDNVLLSPHCADHTPGWMDESMQFFVENFHRFANGEPLQNLVDKRLGY
ncbi:MAG: D-2-hydroxyacid dehydrogenase [Candidatus Solibacter usitatus]|nr:D-2-hydroxyacid dehydrogenase [Candidatus Solibacter usitatus]